MSYRYVGRGSANKGPRAAAALDVACVGEVALDLRAAPEGALLEAAPSLSVAPGGGAVNTALALARLGMKASLCAAVGEDPLGRGFRARVAAGGVDVGNVKLAKLRTGLVFAGAAGEGGRSFVSYRDPDSEAKALLAEFPKKLGAQIVHLSGLVPTRPCIRLFRAAIDAAKRDISMLSIDLNARPRFWRGASISMDQLKPILKAADLIKFADADLAVMGIPSVAALRELTRLDCAFIATSGAGPVRAEGFFGPMERTPTPIEGVDPSGAGDAFCAGLLVGVVRSRSARKTALSDPTSMERSLDLAMEAARAHLLRRRDGRASSASSASST